MIYLYTWILFNAVNLPSKTNQLNSTNVSAKYYGPGLCVEKIVMAPLAIVSLVVLLATNSSVSDFCQKRTLDPLAWCIVNTITFLFTIWTPVLIQLRRVLFGNDLKHRESTTSFELFVFSIETEIIKISKIKHHSESAFCIKALSGFFLLSSFRSFSCLVCSQHLFCISVLFQLADSCLGLDTMPV